MIHHAPQPLVADALNIVCRDIAAVLVMGHQDSSDIATHYVERIGDERLRRVTDHVRQWVNSSAA
ncbi:MAG: hypothetical protein ACF8GE_09740 [Phycisphaerales bacterium JB043]